MTDRAGISLSKEQQPKTKKRVAVGAAAAGAFMVVAGTGLWLWQPWVDRTPFTAYLASPAPGEYAKPGSTPGSCVPHASDEEITVFDGDGKKLARSRQPHEGTVLSSEFGDFAGDCLVVTRLDHVRGGEGTYFVQWGGGNKVKISEKDLRRPADEQANGFKTLKKNDLAPPALD
ncbi:hypothetical protein ACFXKR_18340 [Streptomyces violascens]|uniref:hypothetical protein n=1 Tax=Streptomyces violascens TaxID=67381 RepID=UPI0036CD6B70